MYNEWQYHPKAEYMEVCLHTGKVFFYTKKQLMEEYDITEKELESMESIFAEGSDRNDFPVLKKNGYIVMKK